VPAQDNWLTIKIIIPMKRKEKDLRFMVILLTTTFKD
jgi:hypothetical protein